MNMTGIDVDNIVDIVNLAYVVGEAANGRCATAGDFSGDADGVIKHNRENIAHVSCENQKVTMAAYGHGQGEDESNDRLNSCRFVIASFLANAHGGWRVCIADHYSDFNSICEGEGE